MREKKEKGEEIVVVMMKMKGVLVVVAGVWSRSKGGIPLVLSETDEANAAS